MKVTFKFAKSGAGPTNTVVATGPRGLVHGSGSRTALSGNSSRIFGAGATRPAGGGRTQKNRRAMGYRRELKWKGDRAAPGGHRTSTRERRAGSARSPEARRRRSAARCAGATKAWGCRGYSWGRSWAMGMTAACQFSCRSSVQTVCNPCAKGRILHGRPQRDGRAAAAEPRSLCSLSSKDN